MASDPLGAASEPLDPLRSNSSKCDREKVTAGRARAQPTRVHRCVERGRRIQRIKETAGAKTGADLQAIRR
jgi:hypothetical protein